MRIYIEDGTRPRKPRTRRVSPISAIQRVAKIRKKQEQNESPRHSREERIPFEGNQGEGLRHFDELELEVERLQDQLDEEKRPFRIQLSKRKNSVILAVYRTLPSGKELLMAEKDITNRDFTDWAKMIMEGEGVLFNQEG